MDKPFAIVAVVCILMIAFLTTYHLSNAGLQNGDNAITVNIVLNVDSISVSSSRHATVNDDKVTITSSGTYNIEGSLADGQIIVDVKEEEPVNLILKGVSINCSKSAPIFILNAEEVFIHLEEGTENFVSDAKSYAFENPIEDEPNAAIFSKTDLTVLGTGSLTAVSNYNDAIASKDGLTIEDSTINLTSVDDGIRGKDYLIIKNAAITLNVEGDGLKSDNTDNVTMGYVSIESSAINIQSGGDAIQAQTNFSVRGGSLSITSGGGSSNPNTNGLSAKGIKAVESVTIDGGALNVDSADDALHSNGKITINAGSFSLSSGDDAIHADASVEINGGNINIARSVEGIESAVVTINNGDIQIASTNDGIDAISIADDTNSGFASLVNATLNIVSGGDAIQAGKNVEIEGGSFVLTSGGGSSRVANTTVSSKGIKGVSNVVINGGKFTVNSADDALHSNGKITINAGSFSLSSGDDAIHADASVEINGGDLNAAKCVEGIESAAVTINDGKIIIVSSGDGLDATANADSSKTGTVTIVNGEIDIRSGGDAVQAEREITITGGTLRLTSVEDAIQAGTNVLIGGGSLSSSSGGGSSNTVVADVSAKGVKGTAGVTVSGGVLQVDSADDAVHSNGAVMLNGGSLVLLSGDDAIHSDTSITINNGKIEVKKCYEGIEAPVVTINDGTIHVESMNDGINLGPNTLEEHPSFLSNYTGNVWLRINGGYISVKSMGDGIDSNGAIVMTGGVVLVESPWSLWHSAFDHVAFNITGGVLVAVGSSNWEQSPGLLSEQASVMLNLEEANQAGTLIHVRNSFGDEVFTFKPTRQYKTVVFSMPSVAIGSSYDIYFGGMHTGTIKDGLYSGGTYTPGTIYNNFTVSDTVTVIGQMWWVFR